MMPLSRRAQLAHGKKPGAAPVAGSEVSTEV
jgi:hypothetical protein